MNKLKTPQYVMSCYAGLIILSMVLLIMNPLIWFVVLTGLTAPFSLLLLKLFNPISSRPPWDVISIILICGSGFVVNSIILWRLFRKRTGPFIKPALIFLSLPIVGGGLSYLISIPIAKKLDENWGGLLISPGTEAVIFYLMAGVFIGLVLGTGLAYRFLAEAASGN